LARKQGQGTFAYLDLSGRGGGLTLELTYNPDAPQPGAAPKSQNDDPFSIIAQYAIVSRDVRKAGEYYQSLGLGGLEVVHNVSVNRIYRMTPANFEMDLGWGRFGDVTFEWIQSTQGPNVYEGYLKTHDEGLHYLAFNVADMDQAITQFKAKDVPVSMSGGWDLPQGKGRFAYLDTEPYGGLTIELLWNQPRAH